MARIAGINIPTNKRAVVALTYIFGIGLTTSQKILKATGIDENTRVKDLTEAELSKIREHIAAELTIEGELQRIVRTNIKRLRDVNSYRGERHKRNLPVRGQRTRTNARTKRGKRVAIGGTSLKAPTKT